MVTTQIDATDSMAPAANRAPVRLRAWLDHLRVMSELPYASLALMPSLVALVRDRCDCVFGQYGWYDERFEPQAFWVERINESALRWFKDHYAEVFAAMPIRMMVQTDGEIVRQTANQPDHVHNPVHVNVFSTYGVRWGTGLPFFSAQGRSHGCLFLYRAEAQPQFSDEDQALLRKARTAIGALDRGDSPYRLLPPARRQRMASARLVFDRQGRLRSRSENALPMLFLANGPRMGVLDWAGFDTQVLPESIHPDFEAMIDASAPTTARSWTIEMTWGSFEFTAEPMMSVGSAADELQWLVTLNYLEPQDLTLARRLVNWPLSPQEKRVLIASTREASLADVAAALNLTLGSLKNYVNRLLQRYAAHTRGELVEQVLATTAPGDRLIA